MLGWNNEIKKELGACGEQVYIGHNVLFVNPAEIFLGDRVRIDPFTFITTKLVTGNNVQICAYAMLGGGQQHTITLNEFCFVGYGSKLFCASEDYSGSFGPVNEFWGNNKIYRGDITFNKFSGVASDVMVFPGVTLPQGCLIGAKSLVHTNMLRSLGSWKIYWGDPLKFQKFRSKENILKFYNDPKWLKHYEL